VGTGFSALEKTRKPCTVRRKGDSKREAAVLLTFYGCRGINVQGGREKDKVGIELRQL